MARWLTAYQTVQVSFHISMVHWRHAPLNDGGKKLPVTASGQSDTVHAVACLLYVLIAAELLAVAQGRMKRLEAVRLEVDSRRHTVTTLTKECDKLRAKLQPGANGPQASKLEFQIDQSIKKMQHKENKLAGMLLHQAPGVSSVRLQLTSVVCVLLLSGSVAKTRCTPTCSCAPVIQRTGSAGVPAARAAHT
jgi:hypothetical protein